jgi:hypothetical protein
LLLLAFAAVPAAGAAGLGGTQPEPARTSAWASSACLTAPGPEYYAFPLAATANIPGTGYARGRAELSVPESSPFPIALGADGSYVYDIHVRIERMRPPSAGRLVAWVTTPQIDQVSRVGVLDEHLAATGPVRWNKFIVVVTLEQDDDPTAATWSGPIVFRGMSRSGAMHTMLGHGALQQENCTSYGFGG